MSLRREVEEATLCSNRSIKGVSLNRFGWCITGHHDDCPGTIVTNNVACKCDCHVKPDTTEEFVDEIKKEERVST